ncbi:MAG: heme o synthase [Arenicellales bacterium]|nr:heme o synthase [Arenicellales bacterium]MDP7218872.1 heme o synthase [Arenicellales bacterium]
MRTRSSSGTPVSAPLNRQAAEPRFQVADYAVLMKPRVMSLVVFTALVGMLLAPGSIDPWTGTAAIVFIAFGAGAAGAINMWYDRDIDAQMRRTMQRPLPAGRMRPGSALVFGMLMATGSVLAMGIYVNTVSAALLLATIGYYVFVYTVWLKRITPQNVVIGGVSGALPPVVGWASVSADIGLGAIALFLIIFLWTPPHSWALALFRRGDYQAAGVPMLPVVAGERATQRQMIAYTALLLPTSLLPVAIGLSGVLYAGVAVLFGIGFAFYTVSLWQAGQTPDNTPHTEHPARRLFFFSIQYLFALYLALLIDQIVFYPLI